MSRDAGGRLFGVFWGSLVVIDLAALCHVPRGAAIVGIAFVVAVGSWRQSRPTVLAAAGMGWLFVNGFLVNRLGVLRWDGIGDLWRLLIFLAVAWAAAKPGNIDGFLTRGQRNELPSRVPSQGPPGHPGRSVHQEKHAVRD